MPAISSFRRSIYRATTDMLYVLETSENLYMGISDAELQAICYFGRVVAHAWLQINSGLNGGFPYAFTFGAHGGPISEDLSRAADQFISLGHVAQQPAVRMPEVRILELRSSGSGLAEELDSQSHDPASAAPFLRRVTETAGAFSLSGLMNAIQQEPSLRNAREQRLREGVPLGGRQDEVVAWLRALLRHPNSEGFRTRPDLLGPALLDALRWAEEVRT